jgi:hypothetical protein
VIRNGVASDEEGLEPPPEGLMRAFERGLIPFFEQATPLNVRNTSAKHEIKRIDIKPRPLE